MYWAAELLQALDDLRAEALNGDQRYRQTALQGLKVLEVKYGMDSVQYKMARQKTMDLLNEIKNELKNSINGDFITIYIKFSKSNF